MQRPLRLANLRCVATFAAFGYILPVTADRTPLDMLASPVIDQGLYAYTQVNVAAQRATDDSLPNWTERTIRLRKEVPEVGWGDYRILETPATVLATRYDWHESATVFIHNLSNQRIECGVDVTINDEPGRMMVCLQTDQRSRPDENGLH